MTLLLTKRRSQVRKAKPTPGDAHINAPLTNISVAHIQRTNFVADKVFPVVPVSKQSDSYYIFDRDDFYRDEARVRAPGTESAGGGFALTTASYNAVVEAYHKDVDDQLRANADSVLSLDRAATEFVTQKMMIRRERRWANGYFTTGVWGTDITPSVLWSTIATADPLGDVETGKLAIAATGFQANTMVLEARVLSKLRQCTQIKDQFKYTSSESITTDMLAGFFGLDRILVMDSVYQPTIEGGTGSPTFIGGKHALLCYSAPSPSLMLPTAGYTFAWSGLVGSSNGIRMKRFRMEELESDRIEGQMAYDMKVVAPSMGYFFNGAVA